jgi:hypothetical protein
MIYAANTGARVAKLRTQAGSRNDPITLGSLQTTHTAGRSVHAGMTPRVTRIARTSANLV